MLRSLTLTATLLFAAPATAEMRALMVANEDYRTFGKVSRGDDIVRLEDEAAAAGFEFTVLDDQGGGAIARALGELDRALAPEDTVVVALTGRFVTDGDRTWLLAAPADRPSGFVTGNHAVSVEAILAMLGKVPGRAVLALGSYDRFDTRFDGGLSEGIGALDIPQGVTVLRGEPQDVADFLEDRLFVPDTDLAVAIARDRDITAEGFLPRPFVLVTSEGGAAVEDTGDDAAGPVVLDDLDDATLWRLAQTTDTVRAYQDYLRLSPRGAFREEALNRIAALEGDPWRAERLAEERLNLTRNERRQIQSDLTVLGYNTRGVDGIFGPGTRAAIKNWQQEAGYPQSSYLTRPQIRALAAEAGLRRAEIEAEEERQRLIREREDRTYWSQTGARGTETGLRAYLDRYPEGLFAEEARAALAEIEAESGAASAADRRAWDEARAADSIPAYRAYLTSQPRGAFRDEARARIRQLRDGTGSTGASTAELEAEERALNLNPLTLRLVEARLADVGLDPGPVDGRIDGRTREALRRYQAARNLPATGYLNEATLVVMLAGSIGLGVELR